MKIKYTLLKMMSTRRYLGVSKVIVRDRRSDSHYKKNKNCKPIKLISTDQKIQRSNFMLKWQNPLSNIRLIFFSPQ